ncbi:MAG: aromatic ring-hydroxylating dioxygenase subunit alpha [Actinomycetota bacterium]|nr:aromatic ring-hydroxylating dioxygenase subunit alpha [Actinomycetota bacterium]
MTCDPTPEGAAALAALRASADGSLSAARAMAPAMYHEESILALEQERMFGRDWVCAGLAAEIPSAGDRLTWEIAGRPVFSVRGADGEVRTFSNVCRHRMMALVADDEGTAGGGGRRITCPYHAWTYDLEGRLVGTNHMERTDDFVQADVCLPEVRTEVWHGWIYCTLDDDAPPVTHVLDPMEEFVDRYRMADYVPVHRVDGIWDSNWKLLVENFMEGYHLPVLHRASLGTWMPLDAVVFPDRRHDGLTYQLFEKDENAVYGRAHPDNNRLEGSWRCTTFMPTIFPAHMYILAPDHLWYLTVRPDGTERALLRFGIALAPEVHASLDQPEPWIAEMVEFFTKVCEEDRIVVEGIQAATRSPLAEAGPLSWTEHELHDLAGYLAARLTSDT